MVPGEPHTYDVPESLRVNDWALSGDWTAEAESVSSNAPNGRIAFRFHARDANLVMGPKQAGESVPFRVSIDGEPPQSSFGPRSGS
jgi:hypothetical protein